MSHGVFNLKHALCTTAFHPIRNDVCSTIVESHPKDVVHLCLK